MKITRIKPPKYRVGRFVLNEYELRLLMLEVALKEEEPGIIVRDEKGNSTFIQKDGSLFGSLHGLNFMSDITRMLREKSPIHPTGKTSVIKQ